MNPNKGAKENNKQKNKQKVQKVKSHNGTCTITTTKN